MRRRDVLEYFASVRTNELVIVGPGTAGSLFATDGTDEQVLQGMDMTLGTPMCLGLALALPDRRIVSIEGDGALIASMGVLTTIGRYQPKNLVVLLFDNEAYLSPGHGDIETATAFGADLAGISRASGVTGTRSVHELPDATAAVDDALREDGPWVIVAKVDQSDRTDPLRQVGRPIDIIEGALRFKRALARDRLAAETGSGR